MLWNDLHMYDTNIKYNKTTNKRQKKETITYTENIKKEDILEQIKYQNIINKLNTNFFITQEAYTKLYTYINLIGDYEIKGFGRVDNNTITDIKIISQNCEKMTCDSNNNPVLDLIEQGVSNLDVGKYTLDWHSHAKMGVFWSTTDKNDYMNRCKNKPLLALVINHDMDICFQWFIPYKKKEIPCKLTILQDESYNFDDIVTQCEKDIKRYCTVYEFIFSHNKNLFNTYQNNEYQWELHEYYNNDITDNNNNNTTTNINDLFTEQSDKYATIFHGDWEANEQSFEVDIFDNVPYTFDDLCCDYGLSPHSRIIDVKGIKKEMNDIVEDSIYFIT